MTLDFRLRFADIALRWVAARARVLDLREQRNACFCARAESVSPADYADAHAESVADPLATFVFPQPTQEKPCWKMYSYPEPMGVFQWDLPPGQWCANCTRRQALNKELREQIQHRGALLRGMIRSAKAEAEKVAARNAAEKEQECVA